MNFKNILPMPLLVALSLILTPSCNSSGTSSQQETAVSGDPMLDKAAFAEAIKQPGAVIIDVRFPAEFEQGHIENAINLNFFDPEFKHKLLELNRKKKYYIYCKTENRSTTAMNYMKTQDFEHVYVLKGGYEGWRTVEN